MLRNTKKYEYTKTNIKQFRIFVKNSYFVANYDKFITTNTERGAETGRKI